MTRQVVCFFFFSAFLIAGTSSGDSIVLSPVQSATITDENGDGTPEVVGLGFGHPGDPNYGTTLVQKGGGEFPYERRSVEEFSLSGISVVESATLTFSFHNSHATSTTFETFLGSGDGQVQLSDYSMSSMALGPHTVPGNQNYFISYDVTAALNLVLSSGASFASVRQQIVGASGGSEVFSPVLNINTVPGPGSATWKKSPGTANWNRAGNWTPATVPNAATDTATFASSNTTGVSLSANTEVNGIVFNVGASAFTITASPSFILTISGVGITNNSGIAQNFVADVDASGSFGSIQFTNSATAGSLTAFTNNGSASGGNGGRTLFNDTSTAGNGTFINNGAALGTGGSTQFFGTSTAGNGTFTNNGSGVIGEGSAETIFNDTSTAGNGIFTNNGSAVSGAPGGITAFFDTSTAGNGAITNNGANASGQSAGKTDFGNTSTAGSATITNNGGTVSGAFGSFTDFANSSTAGSATLIANGGTGGGAGGAIFFSNFSTGGTARVEVFGNGFLDISYQNAPGVTIGSIEGSGAVFLGANNLTVGSNKLNTIFSGVMQDGGGIGGTGGSLTKTGKAKLSLTNANTYTGGTTINSGTLFVNNTSGSGTGASHVQVSAGKLGGIGRIGGAVIVGTGSGAGAVLSPGKSATSLGILTTKRKVTFNSDATYKFQLNSSTAKADKVVAKGVTINSGAQFSFADHGTGTLTLGTVFTVIDNTAATPIAGTFSNLPDGSTFTSNGNSFKVSYTGGDGNDLTLTVVP
jgi:hypothetical protein